MLGSPTMQPLTQMDQRRRQRRAAPRGPGALDAELAFPAEACAQALPGRLLDLSAEGARLVCREGLGLTAGRLYQLRLDDARRGVRADLPVQVRWVERVTAAETEVGVRLLGDRTAVQAVLRAL